MASSQHKDLSHIPKFNGSNFPIWKFHVWLMLRNNDLDGVVTGQVLAPIPQMNADNVVINANAITAWNKKDISAQSIISSTIEEAPLRPLLNCRSSADMWTRLLTQHEQNAKENRHLLQEKFFTYVFEKGGNLMSHISNIESLATRLKDIGVAIDDQQIITKILCTLPPSFRHAVSVWDSVPDTDRTIALLTARLLKEETMNQMYGSSEASDAAFFSRRHGGQQHRDRKGSFSGENRSKQQRKCNICGRSNHLEKDCWSAAPQKNRRQSEHSYLASSGWDCDDYAFTAIPLTTAHTFLANPSYAGHWFADSGASQHMTDQRSYFLDENFSTISVGAWPVRGIGNKLLFARGRGNISITTEVAGYANTATIHDVLFVPNLGVSLLSIPAATKRGVKVIFDSDSVKFFLGSKTIMTGTRSSSSLYRLNFAPANPVPVDKTSSTALHINSVSRPKPSLRLWHERLGPINLSRIKQMASSNIVTGLRLDTNSEDGFVCTGCALGKHHRSPFPTVGRTRAARPGQLIHSDLCGPMNHFSIKGARYFLLFKDDFSGYRVIHFLKEKSEVFGHFKDFVARCRRETGHDVTTFRTDNGGEFVNSAFSTWLRSQGIQHQTSAPYCPEQNGVAERDNRTIVEAARSMLHGHQLPLKLWAEAVNTAVYILNRVSSRTIASTAYEAWHGQTPDLSHFRAYGCKAFMFIPDQNRKKLDAKSIECILVGYCENQKAYRLFDPTTNSIRISRDVLFDESNCNSASSPSHDTELLKSSSLPEQSIQLLPPSPTPSVVPAPHAPVINTATNTTVITSATEEDPASNNEISVADAPTIESISEVDDSTITNTTPDAQQPTAANTNNNNPVTDECNTGARRKPYSKRPLPPPRDLSSRVRQPPSEWWKVKTASIDSSGTALGFSTVDEATDDPVTYQAAITSKNSPHCIRAMTEELESLTKNNTWILTSLPAGRSVVGNKWVFKTKRNIDGTVDRFKARLVAKGYSQRPGVDFNETFSPVVRHESIRAILAIAAVDLDIIQLDVKTAFLNGKLHEEIFMVQPPGFITPGCEKDVCLLQKNLYGLKQASRAWNELFDQFLTQFGLVQSLADPCVYHQQDNDGEIIVAIWVDDALVCSTSGDKQRSIISYLQSKFEMTVGSGNCFVGLQIQRNRRLRTIHVNQNYYILNILQKFGLSDCSPNSLPADPHAQLTKTATTTTESEQFVGRYREAVGSLLFAAICTRPDICYAVNQVAQYSATPSPAHWNAVLRIFRYLKSTADLGICFGGRGESTNLLKAYGDADYAANIDTRRSITGFVLMLNGGPISWGSQRQRCTSLSTTEAEYIAQSETSKEVVWTRRLLMDLNIIHDGPTPLPCDNHSAIRLVKNPEFRRRSKHIDVRYHFIREQQEGQVINIDFVPSADQLADLFTKPLPNPRFHDLRTKIGIILPCKD